MKPLYKIDVVRVLVLILFVLTGIDGYSGKKPNILIIHVDDLGKHDLGFTGSKIYQTPSIDKLSAQSLVFANAYSSYPRCVPSRYGMMTATYPVNENKGNLAKLDPSKNFIKRFNEAGYKTSYIGKWHLGEDDSSPEGFGFTHSYAAGGAGATGSHYYPFNTRMANTNEKYPVPDVEGDGKEGDYLSDVLTNASIDFIENTYKEAAFFAVLAFYAVHTPIEAKKEDEERNQKEIDAFDFGDTPEYIKEGAGRRKMRQDDAAYAGMVENVDENVGRIIAKLNELGILDNTIIVLSSDHGGLSNDGNARQRHLATTNLPLKAGKGWLYEGGIRIPFFVHWPDEIKPGTDNSSIIMGMDVMPTLLDLALNQKMKGVEGQSFEKVIKGKESWSNRTVFWHSSKARPYSTGDPKTSAVRSGKYKLVHFYEDNKVELYDLSTDPGELKDLSASHPELTDKLLAQLYTWKAEHNIN